MASCLITGVAGFIGSWLAKALVEQGHDVRGIDNLSTGSLARLAVIAGDIDFHHADLLDSTALARACQGVDVVFHQAALASVARSVLDPRHSHRTNSEATFELLLAARDAGVGRVVYASSSSVYGDAPHLPKVETMLPTPLSPYAAQKLGGEHYMQSFHRTYGIETVCLRYFNVFGPSQGADSPYAGVLGLFIDAMLRGVTPTIHGDGLHTRDFVYVSNIVQANLLAAFASRDRAAGQIYNIASGESRSVLAMYAAIAEILNFPHPPSFGPGRVGDVRHSVADISAAHAALGFSPQTGFSEGLERTVAWFETRA